MWYFFSVLQEAALRTYHISDDPANYYLAEVTDKGSYSYNQFVFLRLSFLTVKTKQGKVVDNTLEYVISVKVRSHFALAVAAKKTRINWLQKRGYPTSYAYHSLSIAVVFAEGGEQSINSELPLRTQLLSQDGKRPSIFLRYKEKDPDRGYIRIYPGSQR